MSELARYEPANELVAVQKDPTGGRLVAWANGLAAAHQIGTALCGTSFVPKHFQGQPEESAAAIMFGDEIGFTPTQSLRSIYVIGGTPALYARAMVALVMAHGHEVWTVEDTPNKVTVSGKRRGTSRVETITWTQDRARKAGYTNNKKYTSDPQAMLYARASGDVARRVAPDVLAGVAYTVEEMELEATPTAVVQRELAAAPTTTRRTAQRRPPPAPVQPEEPELDDHDTPQTDAGQDPQAETSDAEGEAGSSPVSITWPASPEPDTGAVEPPPPTEEHPAPVSDPTEPIRPGQLKMMQALCNGIGIKDRQERLDYATAAVGHDVGSFSDLTKAEASVVIDGLRRAAGEQ